MEALKIIKRIISYLVFVIAASLFLKNSVTVALAYYIDSSKAFEASFLPAIYSILTLGITLLFQLLVIGKPKEIEENIYPWILTVPFAVMLFTSIFIIAQAIVTCNNDPNLSVMYAVVGMLPVTTLSVIEIAAGVMFFIKNKKAEPEQKIDEENQISLTKEE